MFGQAFKIFFAVGESWRPGPISTKIYIPHFKHSFRNILCKLLPEEMGQTGGLLSCYISGVTAMIKKEQRGEKKSLF